MNNKVALVTYEKHPELPRDDLALIEALDERNVVARPFIWSDSSVEWDTFDLVVMRAAWDCPQRMDEFRAWLGHMSGIGNLLPSVETVNWNINKSYLLDLEKAGVPIVPTCELKSLALGQMLNVILERGWSSVVVKPCISNDGHGAHLVHQESIESHALMLMSQGSGDVVVQEYQRSVETSGELSIVVIDGTPIIAVEKCPKKGDFRVQDTWGGTRELTFCEPSVMQHAANIVALAPIDSVAVRVDFLRASDGTQRLIELEAIDPSLFFYLEPSTASIYADALMKALATRKSS